MSLTSLISLPRQSGSVAAALTLLCHLSGCGDAQAPAPTGPNLPSAAVPGPTVPGELPPPSTPLPVTPLPADACDPAGEWQGVAVAGALAGRTISYSLADGRFTMATTGATVTGSYTLEGGIMTIADGSSQPAYVACDGGPGSYTVTFADSCARISFEAVDDGCMNRRLATNGLTITRTPR